MLTFIITTITVVVVLVIFLLIQYKELREKRRVNDLVQINKFSKIHKKASKNLSKLSGELSKGKQLLQARTETEIDEIGLEKLNKALYKIEPVINQYYNDLKVFSTVAEPRWNDYEPLIKTNKEIKKDLRKLSKLNKVSGKKIKKSPYLTQK